MCVFYTDCASGKTSAGAVAVTNSKSWFAWEGSGKSRALCTALAFLQHFSQKDKEKSIFSPSSPLKQSNTAWFYWETLPKITPESREGCGRASLKYELIPPHSSSHTERGNSDFNSSASHRKQESQFMIFPKRLNHPQLLPTKRQIDSPQPGTVKSNFPHLTFPSCHQLFCSRPFPWIFPMDWSSSSLHHCWIQIPV